VHDDRWKFEGCPINGPALAALGNAVAVAWFTAASKEPRVLLALSNDAGNSFGAPVRVDDGRSLGRVGLAIMGNGDTVVSWLERHHRSALLKMRRVRVDGTPGTTRTMREVNAVANEFPRMLCRGEDVVLAWTEISRGRGRVHAVFVAADRL
jgi:cell division inhibitor SulA